MLTVLVIEDHSSVRILFEIVLRQWGYLVVSAGTGELGLRIASQTRVHAACIDVGLPGLDGIEVCRELRAHAAAAGRDLPVWMFTGVFSRGTEARALEAGARSLWSKPFRWDQLRIELAQVTLP